MRQKKLLLLSFLFLSGFSYAQNKMNLPVKTGTWILDKTVNNVEFYHMLSVCDGKGVVFLRLSNRNNYPVKIIWKESFDTQFEKNAKGLAGQKHLNLSKGEFVQGGCNASNFKEGVIQPEQITPTYPADVHGFEFVDVKVIRLQ
jgi:hypothetical protein